jgi:hypothetical protein
LNVQAIRLVGPVSTLFASGLLTFPVILGQVSDGRVKSVSAASAGDLVSDGWTLLDVRPPHEVQKVGLHSSADNPSVETELQTRNRN